jgi:glyoxylase-like metal-dependent hydrolase (beta-lactamase superfamily II)/rhodanese-related sulfurtransferase
MKPRQEELAMTENITSDARDATTPLQLKQAMDAGQQLFMLDVRNADEFRHWRIEGKPDVEILHIPYFAVIEDPDTTIARVPKDRHITVVCAKGGASAFVAEMLRERGFQASNLVGGMVAWGNAHQAREVLIAPAGPPDMRFYQINRFGKGCLSYLIGSAGTAIVVDPSRHVDAYIRLVEEHGFKIQHVFDTHLHADHISGGRLLADHARATYHIQAADAAGARFAYEPLQDGQQFLVGSIRVRVIALETPGHTPGSTTFLINDQCLLTGDTLFVQGTGRPDLGGMAEPWARSLYHTLFEKLGRLPDEVWVLPAHFSDPAEVRDDGLVTARLGDLRKGNAALQSRSEEKFVRFILAHLAEQPAIYQDIRKANLGLMALDEDRLVEMELGKNQCAADIAKAKI